MKTQPQQNNELTLSEKMKVVQHLAIFPALTILVFIRRKVGFRMLKPARLIGMALFLSVLNSLSNELPLIKPFGFLFSEFPLVMLGVAFFQRHSRWKELCNGERWHSLSGGISYLELLPLPAVLKAHRRIYRFIEPLACFVLAMVIGTIFSRPLAQWIAFSSFALFIYEQALFERQLDRDLDILDGLVVAQVQSETAEHFTGPNPIEAERPLEDSAGIPTGAAFDIQRQIENLRANKRAFSPDNLEFVQNDTSKGVL